MRTTRTTFATPLRRTLRRKSVALSARTECQSKTASASTASQLTATSASCRESKKSRLALLLDRVKGGNRVREHEGTGGNIFLDLFPPVPSCSLPLFPL